MPRSKDALARDMLERYTGMPARGFAPYVVLTNFPEYLSRFADRFRARACRGSAWSAATAVSERITMMDYRIGSPTAALAVDLLSAIRPKATLMLGMCGGLTPRARVGQFILPMAAVRDEGTSRHYLPPQLPALPTFNIQKTASQVMDDRRVPYLTGVIHTTDYRFWEMDAPFRRTLAEERVQAIDMECASLFVAGFARRVPIGALLLVSDRPTRRRGIKTKSSAEAVFRRHSGTHLALGIEILRRLRDAAATDLRKPVW